MNDFLHVVHSEQQRRTGTVTHRGNELFFNCSFSRNSWMASPWFLLLLVVLSHSCLPYTSQTHTHAHHTTLSVIGQQRWRGHDARIRAPNRHHLRWMESPHQHITASSSQLIHPGERECVADVFLCVFLVRVLPLPTFVCWSLTTWSRCVVVLKAASTIVRCRIDNDKVVLTNVVVLLLVVVWPRLSVDRAWGLGHTAWTWKKTQSIKCFVIVWTVVGGSCVGCVIVIALLVVLEVCVWLVWSQSVVLVVDTVLTSQFHEGGWLKPFC